MTNRSWVPMKNRVRFLLYAGILCGGYLMIKSERADIKQQTGDHPLWDEGRYKESCSEAKADPEAFWLGQAQRLDWIRKPTLANNSTFAPTPSIRWFEDGELNVCFNCLDRHLVRQGDKPALIFEADEPGHGQILTYQQLHAKVCRRALTLKKLGVQKGDVVAIYLPMVPDLIISMLACARIGAVHAVVFSGFSAEALADRLVASKAKVLLTQAQYARGGRTIDLRKNVEEALSKHPLPALQTVFGSDEEEQGEGSASLVNVPCVPVNALDPLFLLYTSGSTGHPKGVVHSSGGYLTFAALTHAAVFDLRPDDVYFCTADIGWITGHTYGVYGPLANGATLVLFQGVPTYPDASRFWQIIDTHKVTLFYTAPTALRSLMRLGDEPLKGRDLGSLRVLASVGEPIDPPTWQWFHDVIGRGRCPVMDTWWQTETGGALICPLLTGPQKPGCAAKPLPGIEAAIVNEHGVVTTPNTRGHLCFRQSWPGQAIGIWGDSEYFKTSYFALNPGFYTSGDGAQFDEDGDIWLLGRIDDVLNVSGHRLNSAELEQAVMSDPLVAEACVVGFPHEIKGQGISVFVVLKDGAKTDFEKRIAELKATVRTQIGPIATPDRITIVEDLPKTRSGKIVRRLLRKISAGDSVLHEDHSPLANPSCLEGIVAAFQK